MRYLDIARSVIAGDEQDERNEKTPSLVSSSPSERTVSGYERNEYDERSPCPAVDAVALGLDPALRWVHVSRVPVEATVPPEGWEGIAPTGCGAPHVCGPLGPCHHFTEHGRCWAKGDRQ
jgi:hypothetical protein